MKDGVKFAVYNNTMILVINDKGGVNTLIELNYYNIDLEDTDVKLWHFNRAIGYLTKINRI